jgi:hypothetical protein
VLRVGFCMAGRGGEHETAAAESPAHGLGGSSFWPGALRAHRIRSN